MKQKPRITASEAVFGFAGWLTARKGTLTIGATHSASKIAELAGEWLLCNKLRPPRRIFPKNIRHPVSYDATDATDEVMGSPLKVKDGG